MLVLLPLLLCCSAFFSGSETALFSLTRHQCRQLSRDLSFRSSLVIRLLNERRNLLITLLMGNMLVNVLYFVIGSVLILGLYQQNLLGKAMGSFLNIIALLVLILMGEVMPKLVAARFAERCSLWTVVPLTVVHQVLLPVRVILRNMIVIPLSRLLAPDHHPVEISSEELESLLELSEQHGVIDDQEEQLLQQVLSLSQIKVRDLMKPRVDIKAFRLDDDPRGLIDMVKQTRLSCFPVYRLDLDAIEGVVYGRQVLLANPKTKEQVESLIHPVKFVPELQQADRLLVELRQLDEPMAIAVDEYGGTAGLLTLEDVVEMMVGQIANPHEHSVRPQVEGLGPGRWRVSGRLGIREWESLFASDAPMASVSTIGGLVMAGLGRVPRDGDRITVGNIGIEVEKMDGFRVNTLLLALHESTSLIEESENKV